jgi:recombination protein RecT
MASNLELVKDMMQSRVGDLQELLPANMSPERFVRTTLIGISKNPAVLACTPGSIVRCLLEAAGEGLEPTGLFGGAWLVPFRDNKSGTSVCTLMRSYVGLMNLIRRSGQIASWEARAIRDGDHVELEYGLQQKFVHRPAVPPVGEIIGVYSLVRFTNGTASLEVMSKEEVDKRRAVSRARDTGPWRDWYEPMALKTVIRTHAKYLPLDPIAAQAIQNDDEEFGAGFGAPKVAIDRGEEIRERARSLGSIRTGGAADIMLVTPEEVATDANEAD